VVDGWWRAELHAVYDVCVCVCVVCVVCDMWCGWHVVRVCVWCGMYVLCRSFMELGAASTAMELFERLGMWEEVLCDALMRVARVDAY